MHPLIAAARTLAARPTSRRRFILGVSTAGAGLAIGFRAAAATGEGLTDPFAAYVRIAPDGAVTVLSAHFEMGQGVYQGIATLVVEELGASWEHVTVEGAAGNTEFYGNIAFGGTLQGTGGSTAMASSWERYRLAGATAREMLKAAAAEEWGVPADEIEAADSTLRHVSGRMAAFGEMAVRAAAGPVPADVALKPAEAWTEIGRPDLRRFDRVGKTTGAHIYTIDLRLPGMLTAVPVHPPRFGATVADFDAGATRAMPGVVDVVRTPRGLAVVAEHTWAAMRGRAALKVDWDESAAETRGSLEIRADYHALATQDPAAYARNDGDVAGALASADRVIEATYELPFLSHAAVEPLNAAVARGRDGVIEVWGGHQWPDHYQDLAAEVAGVPREQVRMRVLTSGGSFGRRVAADGDVVVEAVATARALGWNAPVLMQWMREDDFAAGYFRPAYVHRCRAALDAEGRLRAWDHHVVGQSILRGTMLEQFVQDGVDHSSVEGASTLAYAVENVAVGLTTTDVRVPVLWWRSVGHSHTAFAVECFIDEIAHAAGADPVAYRLSLLSHSPRHVAVLRMAAEMADWGAPPAEGRARGVAVHESFGTVVAEVAEVSLEDGAIRVHRVWCAVDCGIAINPDVVAAQMEGSIGMGIGAVLDEEVTLTDGMVDQRNYDRYAPMRIGDMPEVSVRIIPSSNPPTGAGEPGLPPIGPAVANAVFAATGRRLRRAPLTRSLA